MNLKKTYSSFNTKNNYLAIPNIDTTKIFVSGLLLISSLFIFGSIQNIDQANAQPSLGQTIQQFQNNLQSNINKEIQSNLNQGLKSSTNNNNCNGSNNVVQAQTSTNGKTTSSTQSSCNGSVSFSSSSNNMNLSSSTTSINSNAQQDLTTPQPPQQQQSSNVTTYNLSNFRATTLQQQNQDITYV